MRHLAILIGAVLTPIAASAHPDHAGSAGIGLVHYVTDSFHIATDFLFIGAVFFMAASWRVYRRRAVLVHRPR